MRTKHILTALALPALFAACTADEFETVNQNAGLQEERAKVAENFTLLTNGIQTRYAVEGGAGISFNFEKGDQIGAAIVDNYKAGEEPEGFEVIYSLAGNYPFEFQGNDQWQSYTQLGIGHYLFTYPYNASDNNRAAMSYELPVIQELGEGAEGLNAAIEKGNKAIAAAILHEGEETVDISLKNLFTYPKLTINFDNGEDVTTVSQIVLKANDKNEDNRGDQPFIVKGGFNHVVVSAMFNPNEENAVNLDKTYYGKWNNATEAYVDWDKVNTYDFLIGDDDEEKVKRFIPFEEGERTSDYIIVKFPEGTAVKPAANTNNKYVEARIMMPSMAFGEVDNGEVVDGNLKGKYTLFVYTDNGVYSAPFEPTAFSFSDRTDAEKIVKALARNASNGLTLRVTKSKEDAGTIVTTLADWNDLVAKFGKTKQDQTVIVVGDDFAFDATAKWPETCTFTINTDVKVEGKVAIENVTVNGAINVEKGATLTVTNTLSDREATDTKETEIVNEGTVIIAAEYDFATFDKDQKAKVAYDGVNYIENKGTVKVAEKANAKFALNNFNEAVVENNGTMEVSDGSEVIEAGKKYQGNHGIINNNGLMRTAGFTNKWVELSKDKTKIVNIPEINNAKGARILSVDGELTNYASLVNEGELTCRNQGGTIVNADDEVKIKIDESEEEESIYPILDSKDGATTYITTNAANATVLVYDDDPALLTIGDQNGDVKYEAAADEKINTEDSQVNVIVANGDLTIENGSKLKTLVVATGTTLTWGSAKASDASPAPTMENLVVEKGVLTLASPDNEVTVAEELTIAEGAQMTVPEGVTFKLEGDSYENNGRILVGGTFKATKIKADRDNVESYGNASEITWAPSAADEAEDAYDAALTEMVQAWILDDNIEDWSKVGSIATGIWNKGVTTKLASKKNRLALATEAKDAYVAWQTALGNDYFITVDSYIENQFKMEAAEGGKVAGIIATYKTYGDNNRVAAFKDKYSETSWLTSEMGGFYRATADTKVEEVVTAKGTKLVDRLAGKMAEVETVDYAEESTADADLQAVQNKAIVLSLKAVTSADIKDYTWVPDYSYVCLYKNSNYGEYEVMMGLLEFQAAETTEANKILNGVDLTTVDGLKDALAKVVDAYADGLGYTLKRIVENYDLTTRIDKVYDEWKFNDNQIKALHSQLKK